MVLVSIPTFSDTVESGGPTEINNYRPISLFSSFGQILEKIVANKLSNFMENKKISRDFQFGFQKGPHCKKGFPIFPSPAGMSLTKLSLDGNYDVIYKLFLHRESLVSDIPAGDGNIEKLFLQCAELYTQ
jgi:hypothetical protein